MADSSCRKPEACATQIEFTEIAHHHRNAEPRRSRLHNRDRLRVTVMRDEKGLPVWNNGVTKRHCFGGGRGFIQQRGVRNVESRQIDDHLLEIQQRFEPPLGDFRLIRRVSGIPAWIFQDVSLNHRRRNTIVPSADERPCELVLPGNRAQFSQRLYFRLRFR